MVFYKDARGVTLMRTARSHSARRIRTDPAFERVRENNAEFKRAVELGKIIRDAFGTPFPLRPADGLLDGRYLHARLNRELIRLIKQDTARTSGQRRIDKATIGLLTSFEWTRWSTQKRLFPLTTVDENGVSVTVPAPDIEYGTALRLSVIRIPEGEEPATVADTSDAVFSDAGAVTLQVQLPESGMWIAGLGYRNTRNWEHGMCIVAAGGV